MQINVCDHRTDQCVFARMLTGFCTSIFVCLCVCVCAHRCINRSTQLSCVIQQSGWFMPWILQCFRWYLREFTAICPHFPPFLLHTQTHTLQNPDPYTHKLYRPYVHRHTYTIQLKGQGQKKCVCRFKSAKQGGWGLQGGLQLQAV